MDVKLSFKKKICKKIFPIRKIHTNNDHQHLYFFLVVFFIFQHSNGDGRRYMMKQKTQDKVTDKLFFFLSPGYKVDLSKYILCCACVHVLFRIHTHKHDFFTKD